MSLIQSITPAQTISVVRPYVEIPKVYAAEIPLRVEETIEEKIIRIAEKWGVPNEHLYNLANCESTLDPSARGKDGEVGIVQIHPIHGFTEEQMLDPEFSLNWAAQEISEGRGYQWTCGNCYSFVQVSVDYKIPRMNEIVPNEVVPRVGSIAIFRYKNEKHIAVIESVVEEGIWIGEANFEPNKIGKRLIPFNDPALKGFYRP